MSDFNPGDKVIKRTEKDARNYGTVMDLPYVQQKPGYLAVHFKRQVWIKPENLMHFDEWQVRYNERLTTTCYHCESTVSRVPVLGPLVCESCKAKAKAKQRKETGPAIADYWSKPPKTQEKLRKKVQL